jgi:hypothetical protein
MLEFTQVVFIVKVDRFGRVGIIEIKEWASKGWFLKPGRTPASIVLQPGEFRLKYPPRIGQGAMLLREIDTTRCDLRAMPDDLVGGLIVNAVEPPNLWEREVAFHFSVTNRLPWSCWPSRERDLRETDPELLSVLQSSRLEAGVWYPIEVIDERGASGCGVMQLTAQSSPTEAVGLLRVVTPAGVELAGAGALFRFGRPVGHFTAPKVSLV